MALIECPECKRQVSSEAVACPQCGYPVAERFREADAAAMVPGAQTEQGRGELLAEIHPSWWKYFWHWFFFWLIIPPIVAAIERSATVLRVYRDRITIERGLFSKSYQDYSPRDIRSIDISQSFWARLVGIGDLTISTAATAEGSEVIKSIPDPKALRELMVSLKN